MGVIPTEEQIFAIMEADRWRKVQNEQVFEISGPAGTGKTTLVKMIIERFGFSYDEVLFVAYMGKAVSQLARSGLPSKTLHSTIYDYKKVIKMEDGQIVRKPNGAPKLVGEFVLKSFLPKRIKLIILDEGSTVEEKLARDLMSFGIMIIVLGDLNQLPPPFGKSIFLKNPNITLTQIQRQSEGDPIIWLSQQVLHNKPLKLGVYKNSAVISKNDLSDFHFRNTDIVLTGTNKLRASINDYYRKEIKGYKRLEFPHVGEKAICRRNNWDRQVDNGIYLTNGTAGYVTYVDRESYNGSTFKMDFRADFSKKEVRNLTVDFNRLKTQNISEETGEQLLSSYNPGVDIMEYAYAITTHASQGSQYENVVFLAEKFLNHEDHLRLLYTGITRARSSVIIVI